MVGANEKQNQFCEVENENNEKSKKRNKISLCRVAEKLTENKQNKNQPMQLSKYQKKNRTTSNWCVAASIQVEAATMKENKNNNQPLCKDFFKRKHSTITAAKTNINNQQHQQSTCVASVPSSGNNNQHVLVVGGSLPMVVGGRLPGEWYYIWSEERCANWSRQSEAKSKKNKIKNKNQKQKTKTNNKINLCEVQGRASVAKNTKEKENKVK